MTIDVIKAVAGQKVWIYPDEGRPTALPTVMIKDEYGNTVTAATTSNVTQDTVNTTPSTAGSVGDITLALTTVVGIEWRKSYLITNSLGQHEWVRVLAINSSTKVVTLDEKLEYAHDTLATFQGCGFCRTLQTAEVASLAETQRVHASYVVGGVTYNREVNYDVVLTPIHSPLTVEFLKKRRPDIMAQEHAQTLGTDYADLREVAWDKILSAIRMHQYDPPYRWRPSLVRTPSDLDAWAMAELDFLLWDNGVDVLHGDWDPQAAVEELRDRIRAAKAHSLSGIRWIDYDEDDSESNEERQRQRPDCTR